MRQCYIIVCPLLLAVAACGPKTTADEQTAAADPSATATASTAAVAGKNAQLPLTAQAFIDAVNAGDKFEIESARIMQATGPGQPLTAFTQMMLRDHQTSTRELRQAANQADDANVDDQKLTAEQDANLAALRGSGAQMPALYKRQQLEAHQQMLAILQNYATSGDNPALMAFATKAIPVVSHHLEATQKLP